MNVEWLDYGKLNIIMNVNLKLTLNVKWKWT